MMPGNFAMSIRTIEEGAGDIEGRLCFHISSHLDFCCSWPTIMLIIWAIRCTHIKGCAWVSDNDLGYFLSTANTQSKQLISRVMQAEGAFQLMAGRPLAYCAAAAMGFCVNALAYIVIQTSSSLTLKARAHAS